MTTKRQVTTLKDLNQMTPQASREDFAQRVITDYDALPPGYLERLQAAVDETISRRETSGEQSS